MFTLSYGKNYDTYHILKIFAKSQWLSGRLNEFNHTLLSKTHKK